VTAGTEADVIRLLHLTACVATLLAPVPSGAEALLEVERQVSERLEQRAEVAVASALGPGAVRVTVRAEMDADRVTEVQSAVSAGAPLAVSRRERQGPAGGGHVERVNHSASRRIRRVSRKGPRVRRLSVVLVLSPGVPRAAAERAVRGAIGFSAQRGDVIVVTER